MSAQMVVGCGWWFQGESEDEVDFPGIFFGGTMGVPPPPPPAAARHSQGWVITWPIWPNSPRLSGALGLHAVGPEELDIPGLPMERKTSFFPTTSLKKHVG